MNQRAFLGIDVSKGYADFLLLNEQKQSIEEAFVLEDNSQGRKQLKVLIEKWFSQGIELLYCGVESTGGYENNWYNFLKNLSTERKVQVARLNAKAVKAVSDATLKRSITDAVSAENIAVYLISFPEKIDYGRNYTKEAVQFKEGRQHNSYVRMQQKQKVQLTNQLEKLLYQHFSEILVYCRHGIPTWLLRMLKKYSCATVVVKAGLTKLSAIKGISTEKADALLGKSGGSTQLVSYQIQHVIAATATEILHKEEILQQEKRYLTQMYQHDEQVKLLTSIKCIGPESAVAVMLEIENINRFVSAKKITAYFGVHPTFKQSGDGTWGSHMSKKGRSEIRAVLYMAALSGIRCNCILKQGYVKCRAKGMKHYQAMGVVMHKLLRIIYGVLKNQTAFDEAIDQKNQNRAADKQQQTIELQKENKKFTEQKKHRYQSISLEAPISRRAAQKRKKQITS
jgi:transposase